MKALGETWLLTIKKTALLFTIILSFHLKPIVGANTFLIHAGTAIILSPAIKTHIIYLMIQIIAQLFLFVDKASLISTQDERNILFMGREGGRDLVSQ